MKQFKLLKPWFFRGKNRKLVNSTNRKRSPKALWKKRWFRIASFSALGLLILSGVGALAGYVFVAKDLPSVVNLEERRVSESTQIYDRTGEVLLYEISGDENRTVISADQIPPIVKQAFISIEDQEFYRHIGVRPLAIIRAGFQNITGRGIGGGASTITQQFVKNALLTNEYSLMRKIREAILAIQIEQKYSKDEIITFYLNEIPFGGSIYGIEAASQNFFGVPTQELEAYQAAMLAAMIQRTTYYSPYGPNLEALRDRQQLVLKFMYEEGYLTPEQYEEQKGKELQVKPFAQNIKAPHFVFYVREKLAEQFGEEALEQGGLRVKTTLDWQLQQIAERVVAEEVAKTSSRYGTENAALGAVDPANGDILAMVGSKDYFNTASDGNVNVLTTQQSPGSSIKPLVYATAFEKGLNPNTYLFDLPTNFEVTPGRPAYEPDNYNERFNGPVTTRRALATSLNIPAVKMLYIGGIKNALRTANSLGISDYQESREVGLAMALGGLDLKLIEHFGAFAAFPNDGKFNPLASIMEVKNTKGDTLYAWQKNEKRVLKEQTARQITDILSDNQARTPVFGFTNNLSIPGVDIAAKTGTSQEFRDALTVGYTTNLVTGVWVGKNDNSPMRGGADGSVVAAPIWNRFMREAIAVRKPGTFTDPDPINVTKTMLNGKFEQVETVKINKLTGNLASANTPPELIENRDFKKVHNILYYIDKENPLGDIPSNPQADPQFANWEAPVRAWASSRPEYTVTPPTTTDTVYTEENRPKVQITSPTSGQTVGGQVAVTVQASAPNGLKQVDVFLNDQPVYSSESGTFSQQIPLTQSGQNTIVVRAFDQYLFRGESSVTFTANVPVDQTPPVITSFEVNGNPAVYSLSATVIDPTNLVQKVEFWDASSKKLIQTLTTANMGRDRYQVSYSPPGRGRFQFYVQAFDVVGNKGMSDVIAR